MVRAEWLITHERPNKPTYSKLTVNDANIQQLRTLNLKTLPVIYTDKFYSELIGKYTTEYLKYAFFNGFVVGSVCARIEPIIEPTTADAISGSAEEEDVPKKKKLYIMGTPVHPPFPFCPIAMDPSLSLPSCAICALSPCFEPFCVVLHCIAICSATLCAAMAQRWRSDCVATG
jgi:hypothetical protein